MINGKQNVKLGKGSISFKNYSKQLPVPFKIYADFECILSAIPSKELVIKRKSSDKNNGSYTEKYQEHTPFSFAYKVVCVGNNNHSKINKNSRLESIRVQSKFMNTK